LGGGGEDGPMTRNPLQAKGEGKGDAPECGRVRSMKNHGSGKPIKEQGKGRKKVSASNEKGPVQKSKSEKVEVGP